MVPLPAEQSPLQHANDGIPADSNWLTQAQNNINILTGDDILRSARQALTLSLHLTHALAVRYGGFMAFLAILISLGNGNAATLDLQINNYIYEHEAQSLLNPNLLILSKFYQPCDLQDVLRDTDLLLSKNKQLCDQQFPSQLTKMTFVNVSTITDKYTTLQGYLNNA